VTLLKRLHCEVLKKTVIVNKVRQSAI